MSRPARSVQTRQWRYITWLHLAGALAVGLVFVLFCAGLLLTIFLINNRRMKVAQVTTVVGQVEGLTDDGWSSLQVGDSLRSGQRIRTASNSSATVRFFEDTETTITAVSDVTLTTVSGRLGGPDSYFNLPLRLCNDPGRLSTNS